MGAIHYINTKRKIKVEDAPEDAHQFNELKKRLGLTTTDVALMFGYSNAAAYTNTSRTYHLRAGFVRLFKYVKRYITDNTAHMDSKERKKWVDSLMRTRQRKELRNRPCDEKAS